MRITVEKGRRINRIRIQGPPGPVTSALDRIHHVFHEATKQEHDRFVAGQVGCYQQLYTSGSNQHRATPASTVLQILLRELAMLPRPRTQLGGSSFPLSPLVPSASRSQRHLRLVRMLLIA